MIKNNIFVGIIHIISNLVSYYKETKKVTNNWEKGKLALVGSPQSQASLLCSRCNENVGGMLALGAVQVLFDELLGPHYGVNQLIINEKLSRWPWRNYLWVTVAWFNRSFLVNDIFFKLFDVNSKLSLQTLFRLNWSFLHLVVVVVSLLVVAVADVVAVYRTDYVSICLLLFSTNASRNKKDKIAQLLRFISLKFNLL